MYGMYSFRQALRFAGNDVDKGVEELTRFNRQEEALVQKRKGFSTREQARSRGGAAGVAPQLSKGGLIAEAARALGVYTL